METMRTDSGHRGRTTQREWISHVAERSARCLAAIEDHELLPRKTSFYLNGRPHVSNTARSTGKSDNRYYV
jgi:hypothetical protein